MLFGVHNSTNQQYLFDFKIWADIEFRLSLTLFHLLQRKNIFGVQVENEWLPGKIIPEIYGCLEIMK